MQLYIALLWRAHKVGLYLSKKRSLLMKRFRQMPKLPINHNSRNVVLRHRATCSVKKTRAIAQFLTGTLRQWTNQMQFLRQLVRYCAGLRFAFLANVSIRARRLPNSAMIPIRSRNVFLTSRDCNSCLDELWDHDFYRFYKFSLFRAIRSI